MRAAPSAHGYGTAISATLSVPALAMTLPISCSAPADHFRSLRRRQQLSPQWVTTGFIQDDWRVGAHLTINSGLRYEFFMPLSENTGTVGPVIRTRLPHLPWLQATLVHCPRRSFTAMRITFRRAWELPTGLGSSTTSSCAWDRLFYDGSIYSRWFPTC